AELARLGIRLGALCVFVPALLSRQALQRRALFVQNHRPELRLPPLGRPCHPAQRLPAAVWLALGHVVLGDVAVRIDLAERVASALSEGQPDLRATRALGLPKRNSLRIAAFLRDRLPPPTPPSGTEREDRTA
ncbi:MAG TPA: hypothetical protein VF103_06655, partial [Polyangiaceae bacterium]